MSTNGTPRDARRAICFRRKPQDFFRFESIVASLNELVTGWPQGRTDDQVITLFKSVGLALEDFAAAELILKRLV
jgi:ornithine cyclodeaminase/alanine dehydrogenase-like protein (mu-crystallin family)